MKHVDWARLKEGSVELPTWEADRVPASLQLRLKISATDAVDVFLKDVSCTGFMFESSSPLPAGTKVEVHLPAVGQKRAEVVWRTGRRHGARFAEEISRVMFDEMVANIG